MTTTEPTNLPAVRVGSLADKVSYAQHLASSALLPRQYQQQPANLLFAIEYAEMLQLPPMAAITGIHVIEGKPSASAALISALVRRAGHRLRVTGNDTEARAQIVRSDDPDFTFESVWTLDRAKQAGLVGKDVWKKYTAAMLKSRAVTEVARDACEEALSGMHYTPEELGAEVDGDGEIVVEQVRDEPEHVPDAEIVQDKPERGTITDAQVKKLAVAMKAAGITDRQEALDYVMSVIGRDVASRNELSKDEASQVIDKLDQVTPTEAEPTDTATGEVIDAEIVPAAAATEADQQWLGGEKA